MAALALADLIVGDCWTNAHSRRYDCPNRTSASVVIPNWNGRDLLEKYLPSVIEAMSGHPDNEVIVVDNASTDGSAEFLRERFPTVRVLRAAEEPRLRRRIERRLPRGQERHRRAAQQRHASGAGLPAAACSMASPMSTCSPFPARSSSATLTKLREETGLTQAWWQGGRLRVTASHR